MCLLHGHTALGWREGEDLIRLRPLGEPLVHIFLQVYEACVLEGFDSGYCHDAGMMSGNGVMLQGKVGRIGGICRAAQVDVTNGMSRPDDGGSRADAGRDMKVRLRADLLTAMKDKRTDDAKVLRALVAALDNAEAPPIPVGQKASDFHSFHQGSAEVERLLLGTSQVREVLMAEIRERECAAAELEDLGQVERAETLRAEVLLAQRYLQ